LWFFGLFLSLNAGGNNSETVFPDANYLFPLYIISAQILKNAFCLYGQIVGFGFKPH